MPQTTTRTRKNKNKNKRAGRVANTWGVLKPTTIQTFLDEHGVKASAIVARLGVSASSFNNWRKGSHAPTQAHQQSISDLFEEAVNSSGGAKTFFGKKVTKKASKPKAKPAASTRLRRVSKKNTGAKSSTKCNTTLLSAFLDDSAGIDPIVVVTSFLKALQAHRKT